VLDLFRRKEYVITVDARPPARAVQQEYAASLICLRCRKMTSMGKARTGKLSPGRSSPSSNSTEQISQKRRTDRPDRSATQGATVREIAVFGGSAHPRLAAEICENLSVPLQPVRLQRFANDCLEVQLQANCRERDVFIIQPLVPPVQEHLVELAADGRRARGASAARVTVVMPHYAYARSDKKNAPRISIAGRLVADLLVAPGPTGC